MSVVNCRMERSPFIIKFIFEAQKEDALPSEPDGIDDGSLSKIILLVGMALLNKPGCGFNVIGFNGIMQRRASIIIKWERNFPAFEDLMERNELLGQEGNQGFFFDFAIKVDLINDCDQRDGVIILDKFFNRVDDIIGLFGEGLLSGGFGLSG
jgi:hypothetical protein